MAYFEGYLIPVPSDRRADYEAFAKDIAAKFLAHGATEVVEGWGSDVPDGELTSFPKSVDLQNGEIVVMAWNRWPSKAVRDAAMDAIFSDGGPPANMPFDGKRMIFGGFEPIIDVKSE